MAIVRGRLSHTLYEDFEYLLKNVFLSMPSNTSNIDAFQKRFKTEIDRRFCVSFQYARTGLYFVLKSMNLPKGTKVIMPSIMIKAYLDVVLDLDLVPVFVDNDTSTGGPSISSLKQEIDGGARVFVLVYLFGIVPNLNDIEKVVKQNGVFVIEDFSQAMGGSFAEIKAGSFGDVSIYSSSAVKIIDTFGGGHVFTDDREIFESLENYKNKLPQPSKLFLSKKIFKSVIRNLVSNKFVFTVLIFPVMKVLNYLGKDSFVRFVGKRSFSPIGTLPRDWFQQFSEIQARMGIQRLNNYLSENSITLGISSKYDEAIPEAARLRGPFESNVFRWQYIVYLEDFKKARKFYLRHGIDVAQTSLIELSNLPEYGWTLNNPGARQIFTQGTYLPFYKELSKKSIKKIIATTGDLIN